MADIENLKKAIARGTGAMRARGRAASVTIALVGDGEEGLGVLLEVRSADLDQQPGEACCPGGHIEPGETPEQAALRETCEELLLAPDQVQPLGEVGTVAGPGGMPMHVFAALLHGYAGTFSANEVASVFTIPLGWLLEHAPRGYQVVYEPEPPADFPWGLVPGGRAYPWRPRVETVPFYDTEPVVWGATARALELFARVVRAGLQAGSTGAEDAWSGGQEDGAPL